ncbi:MAG: diffusible signal factor-reguated Ax21 family protein [Luteimonas sp.]
MTRSLLALTLAAAMPFAASAAEGLNYNYVEGGYVATNLDNDNGDIDADGVGVNASFAISPNFHLFGGFSAQESDEFRLLGSRVETDVNQWRAGVGYNLEIAGNTDLVARVAYEKYEVDDITVLGRRFNINDDDDGYSAEVGVRSAFTDKFEGYAFAGYEDFGNDADDFYGRVGAQVKFNPSWGISGEVKIADGGTEWFVGPRFSW